MSENLGTSPSAVRDAPEVQKAFDKIVSAARSGVASLSISGVSNWNRMDAMNEMDANIALVRKSLSPSVPTGTAPTTPETIRGWTPEWNFTGADFNKQIYAVMIHPTQDDCIAHEAFEEKDRHLAVPCIITRTAQLAAAPSESSDTQRLDALGKKFVALDFEYPMEDASGKHTRCVAIIELPRDGRYTNDIRQVADVLLSSSPATGAPTENTDGR